MGMGIVNFQKKIFTVGLEEKSLALNEVILILLMTILVT
jgi:hypothetical protein